MPKAMQGIEVLCDENNRKSTNERLITIETMMGAAIYSRIKDRIARKEESEIIDISEVTEDTRNEQAPL